MYIISMQNVHNFTVIRNYGIPPSVNVRDKMPRSNRQFICT